MFVNLLITTTQNTEMNRHGWIFEKQNHKEKLLLSDMFLLILEYYICAHTHMRACTKTHPHTKMHILFPIETFYTVFHTIAL